MGPRAKLMLLGGIFALPIAVSLATYHWLRPSMAPTSNYGELLLPPSTITAQAFDTPAGERFGFAELEGKWVLVASDAGQCAARCEAKLAVLRQVRLALGRNAPRVERVFVVEDAKPPAAELLHQHPGLRIVLTPAALKLPAGAANDRAHVYLVDPRGNVMMRWPAQADGKRMLGDLQRLLKASQIG